MLKLTFIVKNKARVLALGALALSTASSPPAFATPPAAFEALLKPLAQRVLQTEAGELILQRIAGRPVGSARIGESTWGAASEALSVRLHLTSDGALGSPLHEFLEELNARVTRVEATLARAKALAESDALLARLGDSMLLDAQLEKLLDRAGFTTGPRLRSSAQVRKEFLLQAEGDAPRFTKLHERLHSTNGGEQVQAKALLVDLVDSGPAALPDYLLIEFLTMTPGQLTHFRYVRSLRSERNGVLQARPRSAGPALFAEVREILTARGLKLSPAAR